MTKERNWHALPSYIYVTKTIAADDTFHAQEVMARAQALGIKESYVDSLLSRMVKRKQLVNKSTDEYEFASLSRTCVRVRNDRRSARCKIPQDTLIDVVHLTASTRDICHRTHVLCTIRLQKVLQNHNRYNGDFIESHSIQATCYIRVGKTYIRIMRLRDTICNGTRNQCRLQSRSPHHQAFRIHFTQFNAKKYRKPKKFINFATNKGL